MRRIDMGLHQGESERFLIEIGEQSAAAWLKRLESGDAKIETRLTQLYGEDSETRESRKMLMLRAVNTFVRAYGPDRNIIVSRAPGRINLLGNHIDHRGGYVNYVCISRDTVLVASSNQDDTVRIANANAERFHPAEFSISALLPADRRGNWNEYIEHADVTAGSWGNYIRAPLLCRSAQ